MPQRRNIDLKQRQPAFAFRCDVEMPTIFDDRPRGNQRIGDGDAEAAGEMVVAGPPLAQQPIARAWNTVTPRLCGERVTANASIARATSGLARR